MLRERTKNIDLKKLAKKKSLKILLFVKFGLM